MRACPPISACRGAVFLVALLVLVFVAGIVLVVSARAYQPQPPTVERLGRSMDLSVSPCDDFYRFACGRFERDTPFPIDRDTVDAFTQLDDATAKQLHELLSEPQRAGEPACFAKAKTLYQSCVNTTLSEELGMAPAKIILAELGLGQWPILEDDVWHEDRFSWHNLTTTFAETGLLYDYNLFEFGVGLDPANTSRHALVVSAPSFRLDGLDSNKVEKVTGSLTTTAELLGRGADDSPQVQEELQAVVMLAVNLTLRMESREDEQNVTNFREMTLRTMQEAFPYVPWLEYTKRMLGPGANVTADERVIVGDYKYLASLGSILRKTPKRVLANFLAWRMLNGAVMPYLNEEARLAVDGEKPAERWEGCLRPVKLYMLPVVSAMYVRRHSSEENRIKTIEMVENIVKEMQILLRDSVDWMDPKTRAAAIHKTEKMKHQVAYAQELLNDTMLDQVFEKLEFRPNHLMENVLGARKFLFDKSIAQYGTDVTKYDWKEQEVIEANAFYSLPDNSLNIPAGVIQAPLYQRDRPQSMNYGAIGTLIGHEVSHGFDDSGALFDMDGQLKDWWEKDTKERFEEKLKCIVDEYNNITDPDTNMTVNGVLTRGENIADNAGVKLAYRAYTRYAERQGQEPDTTVPVPDGDKTRTMVFTPRQMFWLSYASMWCTKIEVEALEENLRNDEHSPAVHRVTVAIRNAKHFGADFQCPIGSPMNPQHKCQVW